MFSVEVHNLLTLTKTRSLELFRSGKFILMMQVVVQGDSKLLLGFPWPVIFKLEATKSNLLRNMNV
jgi:hypothetical protein